MRIYNKGSPNIYQEVITTGKDKERQGRELDPRVKCTLAIKQGKGTILTPSIYGPANHPQNRGPPVGGRQACAADYSLATLG